MKPLLCVEQPKSTSEQRERVTLTITGPGLSFSFSSRAKSARPSHGPSWFGFDGGGRFPLIFSKSEGRSAPLPKIGVAEDVTILFRSDLFPS